jgi:hypothetical protein
MRVPFFFKQWGGVQKSKRGRMLNGRTFDAMPASSAARLPSLAARRALLTELLPLTARWESAPLVTIPTGNASKVPNVA